MSEPTITVVSPLDAIGVTFLPFESPEFQATLPPDRDKTFDYLLHYSAMLSNNTSKSIIAYTILWNYTDANGKVMTSEDAWYNFSTFPSPRHLSAHRSKFVSLLGTDEFDTPMIFSEEPPNLPGFTKQKAVQIVLSSVLFDDGEAVGDDTRNWISRWRAILTSEQDVYSAAAGSPSGKLREVLNQYVHNASNVAKPINGRNDQGDLGYGSFPPAAMRSDKFQDHYALYAGLAAALLLLRFDGVTESDMRNTIQQMIALKKYPQVRKNHEL